MIQPGTRIRMLNEIKVFGFDYVIAAGEQGTVVKHVGAPTDEGLYAVQFDRPIVKARPVWVHVDTFEVVP